MIIDPTEAYKAQTDRVGRLAEFVARFAPAYGTTCEAYGHQSVEDETPGDVIKARDHAVRAAFDAIRKIALNS